MKIALILLSLFILAANQQIDPHTIPKFTSNITFDLPVHKCIHDAKNAKHVCTVNIEETMQQILPAGYPKTKIYAYAGNSIGYQSGKELGYVASFPGPMFAMPLDMYITVMWENKLRGKHILPIQKNLDFMGNIRDFNEFTPTAVHIHGMPNPVATDGGPQSYWTPKGQQGSDFFNQDPSKPAKVTLTWVNEQNEGFYFYHDHSIAMTRLNLYAGLAGPAISVDPLSPLSRIFDKKHDIILAISDKSFYANGSLFYPSEGLTKQYPVWVPEFYGDVMLVNGQAWPNANIEKNVYRVRILNGCNGRQLILSFVDETNNKTLPFSIVKVDQAYYDVPIILQQISIPVSGRVELVVDFTQAAGNKILLKNSINVMKMHHMDKHDLQRADDEEENIGRIMRFTLSEKFLSKIIKPPQLVNLNPTLRFFPMVAESVVNRYATLIEMANEAGDPLRTLINGVKMHVDEPPYDSSKTYDLYIINLTPDVHPMHMHLINFQKWKEATFNVSKYEEDWYALNEGEPPYEEQPRPLYPDPYLTEPWQQLGSLNRILRDVDNVYPDKVTVFRFRFRHNDGRTFGFNIKTGRYVWHCHIVEHEDNEMMRYFSIV